MFKITSQTELLESFRPLDRQQVEVPDELQFPLVVKDYLSWVEPAGARVFLVFNEPGGKQPLGVVFRRDGSGSGVASMCDWCHSVRGSQGVGLLTAAASDKRRVGVHLCRDLSCSTRSESAPGADDVFESLSPPMRAQRVRERMIRFARQHLF